MTDELMSEIKAPKTDGSIIMVVGVGGAGGNAVNHMWNLGIRGVTFMVCNTDQQALDKSPVELKIRLGAEGLGAGNDPENGRRAAVESLPEIRQHLEEAGTRMLFITAGMGGGTGTGAAPVIAEIAKELGILTVAVVTKPFSFEGARRMRTAEQGIENLKSKVDSMIVILNEKLEEECPPNATMKECFETSNEVLYKACVGIAEIIHTPGTINVDFEDLKTVMSERGSAIIGLATASGPDRARKAAEAAIACPLLEGANLQGARGMLVYFTGNESLTLAEIREAMGVLNTFVTKQANVIFGSAMSEEMGDEVRVTVVATGLDRPIDPTTTADTTSPAAAPAIGQPASAAEASQPSSDEPPTIFGTPKTEKKADEEAAQTGAPKFSIPKYLS